MSGWSERKRFTAKVRGRVLGVGFRASAARVGREQGLLGWVRNNEDGGVTVAAEGEGTAILNFLQWLDHGPSAARVDGVDVAWEDPTESEGPFSVRR